MYNYKANLTNLSAELWSQFECSELRYTFRKQIKLGTYKANLGAGI